MPKICLLGSIASIHLQRWAKQLAKRGDEVSVISFEAALMPGNIKIYQIKSRIPTKLKYITSIPAIKKIVKTINPDLVHAHYLTSYGFIGACLNFKPLIVSAWGSDILISAQKNPILNLFVRFAIKKADLVHSMVKFVEEPLIALGANPNKIIIIPLGVDRALLEQSSQQKEIIKTRQNPVIISTRFLEPIYNVDLLIRALPDILEKNRTIRCQIIGGGSQAEKLRKLVQNMGLSNSVEFLGKLDHDELIRYLKMADIFVSTSLSDINNVSLNEAMACGLFPVCTDIPANREWISDGINGFLVPTNSPGVLAQKILAGWQNKQLIDDAKKINKDIINERAILDDNMSKVEKVYQELILLSRSKKRNYSQ